MPDALHAHVQHVKQSLCTLGTDQELTLDHLDLGGYVGMVLLSVS